MIALTMIVILLYIVKIIHYNNSVVFKKYIYIYYIGIIQ